MFNTPIVYVRLKNMEELVKFSFATGVRGNPMTMCSKNGQIAYVNKNAHVFVTPFRPEIPEILAEAGYRYETFHVPFSNGEERPEEYQWLEKIAHEENIAATCKAACKVAVEKKLRVVNVSEEVQRVKEITPSCHNIESGWVYSSMTEMHLGNNSAENIGTYIVIDEKTILICDAYGRTFLVWAKKIINNIVNTLINSGYTRTRNPERYVKRYKPED